MSHQQWLIQESGHDPGMLFCNCSSPEPRTRGSTPPLGVIEDHPIDWSGPTGAS